MTFGDAIERLKKGDKIQRKGWNGKGMYLYLLPYVYLLNEDSEDDVYRQIQQGWLPKIMEHPDMREIEYEPCVVMYTAQGKHQPGWLASQADILSEDWITID